MIYVYTYQLLIPFIKYLLLIFLQEDRTMASNFKTQQSQCHRKRLSNANLKAKQEKSQQAARECRVRKNVRLQYIGDFVANKERAIFALREELEKVNVNFNSSCSFKNKIDILNYAELRDGQNIKK